MIFENSLPKANFGQNIRDSPNGSLTADSRSLQTATLNIHAIFFPMKEVNLPVVVDQSLEGGFSYYPACPQRCIQRCHYST